MATPEHNAIVPDVLLQPQEITRESLVALIQVAEKLNMDIPWWEKYGQPKFDRLVAVFEGPAERAGAVVQQVLGVKGMAPQVRVSSRASRPSPACASRSRRRAPRTELNGG